jgi:hypothetical protein
MHILEPHGWTTVAAEARSDDERRGAYDRTLAAADQALGEVLAAFARRSADRMPIVIVTADHGEALGEHGHPYHSTDLYDAQIRVPLVIAGPGLAPHRIAETVSLTDIVPTVLDLAGFAAPGDHSLDGHSFADLATGRRAGDPDGGVAFAAMIKDRSNPRGQPGPLEAEQRQRHPRALRPPRRSRRARQRDRPQPSDHRRAQRAARRVRRPRRAVAVSLNRPRRPSAGAVKLHRIRSAALQLRGARDHRDSQAIIAG